VIGPPKSSRRTATPKERVEAARRTLVSLAAIHRDVGNGEVARQLLETAAALSEAGPGGRPVEHGPQVATRMKRAPDRHAAAGTSSPALEAGLWQRHAPAATTTQDAAAAHNDGDRQEKRR
jgi:hypothetical protein